MNKYTLVLFIFVLFFSGCTQTVRLKVLEPAEVDRAAKTKIIAVTDFRHDRVGLSNKIETNLSRHKIDGIPFFTLVSRKDINKIIDEQRFQNSGLVDLSTAVEVGDLTGAEAIISGNVGRISLEDTRYFERRSRCRDKKCKERVYYRVMCKKREVSLSAEIRMVDITKGDIIYADSISKSAVYRHCLDDARILPSKELIAQKLAESIADSFTYKLTPHYSYVNVALLEEPDLDYSENQELILKSSLDYIKQNRYDKAEKLLISLIDSTNRQSYVPFYNLGVIKEVQGDYIKAKEFYEKADDLVTEPNRIISAAYVRINSTIHKNEITQEQIYK